MARRTTSETSEWVPDGLLEWCYLGGSWERWRCRLCGATTDRHLGEERIDEYTVHGDPEAAEQCIDRWSRRHRRAPLRGADQTGR
jgi:hypothetical protein